MAIKIRKGKHPGVTNLYVFGCHCDKLHLNNERVTLKIRMRLVCYDGLQ